MDICVGKSFLHGSLKAPPSKSHTLRALICAALADSPSYLQDPLVSEDTKTAVSILQQLGVDIREVQHTPLVLEVIPPSEGLLNFRTAVCKAAANRSPASINETVLHLGNSGSLLYFLGVLLTATTAPLCLTGDNSLQSRPVHPLVALYRQAGIRYSAQEDGNGGVFPPLHFCGPLHAGDFNLTGPFSQPVTGLLLTAPLLNGPSTISFEQPGERPYLKMTCTWMNKAGIEVHCQQEQFFKISGNQQYRAFSETIPGDWSSALFPLTAAVICNSALTLHNLDYTDPQGDSQVIAIFHKMGADIRCNTASRTVSVFPTPNGLSGGCFDCKDIPDAVPILAAAALFCTGTTRLINAGVCRFKECDRIRTTVTELSKFGAQIKEGKDFLQIKGTGGNGLHPARVQSRGDHRIAMMLAVAACGIASRITTSTMSIAELAVHEAHNKTVSPFAAPLSYSYIEDFDCVRISYPDFIKDMNAVGASFFQDSEQS